ncbi:MAG TPA: amidohydrolase family protein [Hyphomonadaceae bacterium]|nr:amidohydrolase family protein [Hyphomonadaceae bacterium]
MKLRLVGSVAVAASLAAALAFAQEAPQQPGAKDEKPKWDVAAPPLPTRTVNINVDEGTWMDVDVSPDGRLIAFDLLGDIYTMPITGGAATRIAEGLPFEMQPQFSPDGKRIAFTSDRGGGDNIWVMNVDGSDKRPLTKEEFRLLNEPSWSPDGRFIAARKHFTTARSLGTGEIWIYHVGGGGGYVAVKKASDSLQKELGEPVYAPDGKSIYYTRNVSPGNTFEYAQDSNGSLFEIEKYTFDTGEVSTVVSGAGGATRPAPSPDGKKLAFVRRERNASKLYVKDLGTGELSKLYDTLDLDLQETWAVNGLYPDMEWLPDSKSIVFWAGGKIRRVDMAGASSVIPFRVNDTRVVIDPPQPKTDVAPDAFRTKMPRFVSVSPDGKRVVFESLGKLYVKQLSGGAPVRLTQTKGQEMELFPSWSRDGQRLVYIEWTDAGLGKIRTVAANGGNGRVVTTDPGHYRRPRFSPDGQTIVFEKGTGGYLLSQLRSDDPGVYRVAASGGAISKVTDNGSYPQFGASNDRVFVTRSAKEAGELVSVDLNGQAERMHATGDMVAGFEVSPDGRHAGFRDNFAAYVMPLAQGPQEIDASKGGSAMPVVKASSGGATYLSWSAGGGQLNWSLGPTLYSASIDQMMPLAPAKDDDKPSFKPPEAGINLSIPVTAAKPSGTTVLTGARIVTMANQQGGVIENGTIVIEGNRITMIGQTGTITVPAGSRTIDLAGKTIIPGMIDAHAHGAQGDDDIIPNQNWSAQAHLALGVTTVFDPSNAASEAFVSEEMQRAGLILGPRTFSTGEIVYGARSRGTLNDISDYDDALAHVRRLKVQGAAGIKNYNQPRRNQRQQVVAASIAENIQVVAEGASLFAQDIALIADGNTALEHNIPQLTLYEDVISFFAQTKVAYTPTLVVTYGGLAGDPYWRSHTDVWRHPILSKHVPPHILQPNNVRRTQAPEEDYVDGKSAAAAKKLFERGVNVSIGAHGQEEGMGAHWELWSFVRGGWSPLQALQAATVMPARKLGFEKDIGSLEVGKLADLVVLDANPLNDIRNSDKIASVMVNGRLYDAVTLNEIGTGNRLRPPYYWE